MHLLGYDAGCPQKRRNSYNIMLVWVLVSSRGPHKNKTMQSPPKIGFVGVCAFFHLGFLVGFLPPTAFFAVCFRRAISIQPKLPKAVAFRLCKRWFHAIPGQAKSFLGAGSVVVSPRKHGATKIKNEFAIFVTRPYLETP